MVGGRDQSELGTVGSGRRLRGSPRNDLQRLGLLGSVDPRTVSSTGRKGTVVCTGPLQACRNYNVKR